MDTRTHELADLTPHNRIAMLFLGIGGAGMTIINHLWDLFGASHAALNRLGVVLLGVDGIRDDAKTRVQPGNRGIDTGEAEEVFHLSGASPQELLERIAASPRPLPEFPSVTPKHARRLLDSIAHEGEGFGGLRVPSYISALLGMPAFRQSFGRAFKRTTAFVEAGRQPIVVIVASIAGGTGCGHLKPYAENVREMVGPGVAVWLVVVEGDAFANLEEFRADRDKMSALGARSVAASRELELLAEQTVDFTWVAGPGGASYATASPLDGALASVAGSLETWARNPGALVANIPDWKAPYGGLRRWEKQATIGGGRVTYLGSRWADLISAEVAVEALTTITTPTVETAARSRDAGRTIVQSLAPGALACEVADTPAGETVALARPLDDSLGRLVTNLSIDPEIGPPVRSDLNAVVQKNFSRFGRVDMGEVSKVVAKTIELDLDSLSDYATRSRDDARRALVAKLRQFHVDELSGADGAEGRNLGGDPAVLVRTRGAVAMVEEISGQAVTRLAAAYDEICHGRDGDPLEVAMREADRRAADLGPSPRRGQLGPWLEAMADVHHYRWWKATVAAALAEWRDLQAVANEAGQPLAALLRTFRDMAIGNSQDVAAISNELELRHQRPDTRVVPLPKSRAAAGLSRSVREALAARGSGQPKSLLEAIRVRAHMPAGSEVGAWDVVLLTPEVPDHKLACTWSVLSRTDPSIAERVADLTRDLFARLARHQGIGGECERRSLFEVLGIEYDELFAPDHGGVVTASLVDAFVGPIIDDLVTASEPLARLANASLTDRPAVVRVPTATVFVDPCPPAPGSTAELVRQAIARRLPNMVAGQAGTLSRVTVTHGVSSDLVRWRNDHFADYLSTSIPVHTTLAGLRAWEIERRLHDDRLLERPLDAAVVRLLDHPNALGATLCLLAFDLLDQATDPVDPIAGPRYYVEVTKRSQLRRVFFGTVADPASAVAQALVGEEADEVRPLLEQQWEDGWAKLKAHHGCDDKAAEARDRKVAELVLPASNDIDAHDLVLAGGDLIRSI